MLLGLDLLAGKDLLDDALLVDDERGADGAHRLMAVHRLLAPGAHGLHQRAVDVGYQREGQLVLLLELHVRGGRVAADADYLVALALQLLVMVAQATGLRCAAAGVVLRVEVEHQPTSAIVTQANLTPLFVFAQYFRRFVSDIHVFFSLSLQRYYNSLIFCNFAP